MIYTLVNMVIEVSVVQSGIVLENDNIVSNIASKFTSYHITFQIRVSNQYKYFKMYFETPIIN